MDVRAEIRERLKRERGTPRKDAPNRIALLYPSPYHVGMSSLGYQTIHREILSAEGWTSERAFLPDDPALAARTRAPVLSYESLRPVNEFPVIAFSVAYELELAGVVQLMELAGIPALAEQRDERHPLVLCGGPLTNSNPLPLAPFADAILMGEADETIHLALTILQGADDREEALATLHREIPSCYVPSLAGDEMPGLGQCDDDRLPAYSVIRTPNTELSDIFLIEAERGCSRGCRYCVMRRSTNGGMRILELSRILERIPPDATKVGLVGAAVSDHPRIVELVDRLAAEGRRVSLSSLLPDKLKEPFVAALKRAGARILTTALDASSQRLRNSIDRKAREEHLLRAAQLAHSYGYAQLKLYMMVGLPDETDADIDELVRFASELSAVHPLALGIAPFVAKRNTPLDGEAFAGIKPVEGRLERLRAGLKGRVDIRATSARWAWVEYVLAQGGRAEGLALLDAVHAGGRFQDYRRAFEALPDDRLRRKLRIVA
jgi:radical SAM superfamily enzyme YgiQ (UPF0313 family)